MRKIISKETRRKIQEMRLIGIEESLKKKYGELFKAMPGLRSGGATLEELGEMLGLTAENKRETPRRLLEHHFPDNRYPARPENLYFVSELLKLSGRNSKATIKVSLKTRGIKPIKRISGKPMWGEEAKNFIQSLLDRPCHQCGEPILSANIRYKYCKKCRMR